MEEHAEHLYKRVRYTNEMIKLSSQIKTLEKKLKEEKENYKQHENKRRTSVKMFKIISYTISALVSAFITPFVYKGDIALFFTSFDFLVPAMCLVIGAIIPPLCEEFKREFNIDYAASKSKRMRESIKLMEGQLLSSKKEINWQIEKQLQRKKTLESQKRALQEYRKSILGEDYDVVNKKNFRRRVIPVSKEEFEEFGNSSSNVIRHIVPVKEEDTKKKVKRR